MPSPTYTPNHPRKPNQVPFFHCSFCRGHFGFTGISPDINGRCGVWLAWSNGRISPQTLLFYAGSTRLENLEITKKTIQTKLYEVLFVVFSQCAVMSEFAKKFDMMAYVVRSLKSCLNMKAHLIPPKKREKIIMFSPSFLGWCVFSISPQIKDIEYKPWRMPKGVKEY